jgi:thiamine pyrophosphokinase
VTGSDLVAVVVIGGDRPHPRAAAFCPAGSLVVAADSGVDHALALGLHVDLVVGDLDSATPEGLAAAEAGGATVERHPREKDAIDTELALEAALARGARRIVLLAGGGDRLDQLLAGLLLLGHRLLAGVAVEAWVGPAHVLAVHGPGKVTVEGVPGALVSLLPVGGAAAGVRTTGLRYPLHGEELPAGTTRGISNELAAPQAEVALAAGSLLVVVPHALAP